MSSLSILEYPDPRLRETSLPVRAFDEALGQLVDDLLDTLYGSPGIGLSAPQIGVLQRVLVMDLSEARDRPELFVNPEILELGRTKGLVEESCLSVPELAGNVIRSIELRVRAQDRAGKHFERDLEGMPAVCLQHEIDHLDGKLFVDRLPLIRRLRARAALARRRRAA